MIENKYANELLNDKYVKEYNRLYEECKDLSDKMRSEYFGIAENIQKLSNGLLKGKRVTFNVEYDNSRYHSKFMIGLGNQGFGYSYWIHGNFSYDESNVLYIKQKLDSKDFKEMEESIKTTDMYKIRWEKIVKAIKKLPFRDVKERTIISYPKEFEKKDYSLGSKYKTAMANSQIIGSYAEGFKLKLLQEKESYNSWGGVLSNKSISQDIKCYSIYPELIEVLKRHKRKLKSRIKRIEKYKESDSYKELLDALRTKCVIENL